MSRCWYGRWRIATSICLSPFPSYRQKALEVIGPECPEFKASSGWAYKFMHRHSLVLRARTSMAQELPATLEERIQAFHRQIKRLAEINKFEVVGNMDETPLYFDVVPGRVLDKKGKKSVVVRTTGNAKRHLTVVLTVLAHGEVLPALAILRERSSRSFVKLASSFELKSRHGWTKQ